jgi:hypothetical protein
MKTTRGQKSRDTVPLRLTYFRGWEVCKTIGDIENFLFLCVSRGARWQLVGVLGWKEWAKGRNHWGGWLGGGGGSRSRICLTSRAQDMEDTPPTTGITLDIFQTVYLKGQSHEKVF